MPIYTQQALQNAKQLRQHQTEAEKKLWLKLRHRQLANLKFRRQMPMGSYIVDFYCQECQLIIELDGGHHLLQQEYDQIRTHYLQAQGLTVLRFWNHDILNDTEAVLAQILNYSKISLTPTLFHWERELHR